MTIRWGPVEAAAAEDLQRQVEINTAMIRSWPICLLPANGKVVFDSPTADSAA
jgi:hypothetical protein